MQLQLSPDNFICLPGLAPA